MTAEPNEQIGMGFSQNEYRTNASVRDQIDGRDLMPPRTDDAYDFADALLLRARIIEAGDRKTAQILVQAAAEYTRLRGTIERMAVELARARTLVAACVTACAPEEPS